MKPYQLLVIPLTIWSGVEQGFFLSDYTAGYVSCVLGVHNVGFVLITYGVFDAICSVSFGAIIKFTGRVPIFLLGAIINIVVVVIFFEWSPLPSQEYLFYILAAMWGISDAVWQTQINGKHMDQHWHTLSIFIYLSFYVPSQITCTNCIVHSIIRSTLWEWRGSCIFKLPTMGIRWIYFSLYPSKPCLYIFKIVVRCGCFRNWHGWLSCHWGQWMGKK